MCLLDIEASIFIIILNLLNLPSQQLFIFYRDMKSHLNNIPKVIQPECHTTGMECSLEFRPTMFDFKSNHLTLR